MPDTPDSPGWHASAGDIEIAKEIGRWILAAIAVVALWVQSHNQHAERIAVSNAAREENAAGLKKIEAKLPNRVYAEPSP